MEGKLIKQEDGYYALYNTEGIFISDVNGGSVANRLSLKNCQAIENGYEFDEYQEGVFYAGNFGHPSPEGFSGEQVGRLHGFIDGFQKALEILGDKKFSSNDIINAFHTGRLYQGREGDTTIDEYIQSLQHVEWDVEIEMIGPLVYTDDLPEDGEERPIYKPKLDADGCLILKRI
jgi:hypothetical protein